MLLFFSSHRSKPLFRVCESLKGFNFQQKFSLVNIKLKWVKDKELDAVVTREKDLKAVCNLVSIISSTPHHHVPVYNLSRHRGQLGLPDYLKVLTFLRRYPNIFSEHCIRDSGGTRVPSFGLTPEALDLRDEELNNSKENETDVIDRLCRLLMLTSKKILAVDTIDQLKWDLGLPYDYLQSLVTRYPDIFSFVRGSSDRLGLRLVSCDNHLVLSQLEMNAKQDDVETDNLAFPVKFTRGFGLKRKCMEWLQEWQRLPYTSPYVDATHLDPRTDVSEKRHVGVFHEILHLTVHKKTERKNVSNLRKPLSMPQKFTKVFERHPGIFYISKKCDTQTVILREAYDGRQLIQKHPLVDIREKYAKMMQEGFLDKSRGVYKKISRGPSKIGYGNDGLISSEEESDGNLFSEYESDD